MAATDYPWQTEQSPTGFISVQSIDAHQLYMASPMFMSDAPPGGLPMAPPAYSETVPAGHRSCSPGPAPVVSGVQRDLRGDQAAPNDDLLTRARREELFSTVIQQHTPRRRSRRRSSSSSLRSHSQDGSRTPSRPVSPTDVVPARRPILRARRRISPAPTQPTSPLDSIEGSTAQIVLQSMNRHTTSQRSIGLQADTATSTARPTTPQRQSRAENEEVQEQSQQSQNVPSTVATVEQNLRTLQLGTDKQAAASESVPSQATCRSQSDQTSSSTPQSTAEPKEEESSDAPRSSTASGSSSGSLRGHSEQTASISKLTDHGERVSAISRRASLPSVQQSSRPTGHARQSTWHAHMSAAGRKTRSWQSRSFSHRPPEAQQRHPKPRRSPSSPLLPPVNSAAGIPAVQHAPLSRPAWEEPSTPTGSATHLLINRRLLQPAETTPSTPTRPLLQPKPTQLLVQPAQNAHVLTPTNPANPPSSPPLPLSSVVPPLGHLPFGSQLPPLAVFQASPHKRPQAIEETPESRSGNLISVSTGSA